MSDVFGFRVKLHCNNAIEEYGIVLLDNKKRTIIDERMLPKTSAEINIFEDFDICETNRVSYNSATDSLVSELPGNKAILADLEKGKTYYWYVYLICKGQKIESDMQSFVFEPGSMDRVL